MQEKLRNKTSLDAYPFDLMVESLFADRFASLELRIIQAETTSHFVIITQNDQ